AGISAGREGRASVSGGRRRSGTAVRTRLGGRTARTPGHPRIRAALRRRGRDRAAYRGLAVGENLAAPHFVGATEATSSRPVAGGQAMEPIEAKVRDFRGSYNGLAPATGRRANTTGKGT